MIPLVVLGRYTTMQLRSRLPAILSKQGEKGCGDYSTPTLTILTRLGIAVPKTSSQSYNGWPQHVQSSNTLLAPVSFPTAFFYYGVNLMMTFLNEGVRTWLLEWFQI